MAGSTGTQNLNGFDILRTGLLFFSYADFAASGNAYLTQYAQKSVSHADVPNAIVWTFLVDALGANIPLPYYLFDYNAGSLTWQAVPNTTNTTTQVEIRWAGAVPALTFITIRYYVLQQKSGY